jgi:hypothetical protein
MAGRSFGKGNGDMRIQLPDDADKFADGFFEVVGRNRNRLRFEVPAILESRPYPGLPREAVRRFQVRPVPMFVR